MSRIPSVKEPMVDVGFFSLTGESHLKTNGFKASCRASPVSANGFKAILDIKMAIKKRLPKNQWLMSRRFVSLVSLVRQPMVLRRCWPAAVSPGIVSRWDIKMAIKNRLPKNQWLMSRRFVSFSDGSKKLTKMVNTLHLSAKEQIRLPNKHWFFGRRNCKVH